MFSSSPNEDEFELESYTEPGEDGVDGLHGSCRARCDFFFAQHDHLRREQSPRKTVDRYARFVRWRLFYILATRLSIPHVRSINHDDLLESLPNIDHTVHFLPSVEIPSQITQHAHLDIQPLHRLDSSKQLRHAGQLVQTEQLSNDWHISKGIVRAVQDLQLPPRALEVAPHGRPALGG